ncbi:NACHT and WD repeat domain-containing protein 2-like [Ylistrum balloti]|uniref:NACHT and WD repeat domain-containing protein 2-like n=1 Tax=Ylistrum balloti TaxID=509963 RepID=UPI002905D8A4|nr:NACHT and WD repeat domain-containing protein 2-like [Ylistrum balloti]
MKMNGVSDDGSECHFRYRHLDDVIESDQTHQKRAILEAPLRYDHLEKEQRETVGKLLMGGLPVADIPKLSPKTVRLYVSSAGYDTEAERTAFMLHVYPDLREYCRDQYGVDFQAVDLKWGANTEGMVPMPTENICLREIRHCRQTSMGPVFLGLVGQKHRRYLPPEEIPGSEFERIYEALVNNGHDVTLLETYYREDRNVTPVLRRLTDPVDVMGCTIPASADTLARLQHLLTTGADLCLKEKSINETAYQKYQASDLHMEGLYELSSECRADKSLIYIRNFSNTDKIMKDTANSEYIDIDPITNEVDTASVQELDDLKSTLKYLLPSANITETEIEWTGNGLKNPKREQYLQTLSRKMFTSVKTLVDRAMEKRDPLVEDELYNEVLQHYNIATKMCPNFHGRTDILAAVKEYLLSETDQPLIITGEAGSGKSSVMAKIALDINVAIQNNDLAMRTSIICRFLGKTQKTLSAQQLLFSVCHQLAFAMGKYRHEVPSDYKTLKLYFIDLLQRGEFGGMIIILLDSLDVLSTCDNGHKLEWLPSRVAANIKIVVTTSMESKDTLQRLTNKCPTNIYELTPFSSTDCEDIVKLLMNARELAVTYDQWKTIKDAFKESTLPLYVTLVSSEVCRWRSFDDPNNTLLGSCVEEIVESMLDRLEQKHGLTLVSTVLGYITASKAGLSENELLDILSVDDVLLSNLYVEWHPPIRRFLPRLFSVIKHELDGYIEEREMDGILVMFWKCPLFSCVAENRYLSDEKFSKQLHSNIADYYMGKWSGARKKPFHYPSVILTKRNIANSESEACRLLPKQPHLFGTSEVDERYNHRKMTQLPYSLMKSERYDDLREQTFCNFDHLYYRIKSSSLQQLLTDIDMFEDRQTALVGDALRMSGSALEMDLNALGVELSGRLIPHIKTYPYIKQLIRQCDLAEQRLCPLVPKCQIYSAPGGPLQYECDVGGNVYCPVDIDVFSSEDGILLTAKPYYSSRVRVWELSRGDPRPDMMMPVGEIHPTRNGKYLNVFQNDRSVKIFKSDCGELHGKVEYGLGTMSDLEVSNKYLVFAIEKGAGPYVIDLTRCVLLHKFSFHTHAVAINPNDTHLTFNSGRTLILYELPLMERRCVAQTSDVPQDIIFISKSLTCFVLTRSKMVESVFFDIFNRKYKTNCILTDLETKECILSHTEKYLLVRSAKCLHQVNVDTEKIIRKYQQLPNGIFVDPLSQYTGAGFTPDDELIVASRYTYLAVWCAHNGEPLRVLQASVSPITKMFTSEAVNKCVSLLEDNSFQVWNLDNLDSDILHSNEVFPGPVIGLAVSSESGQVVAYESRVPEAKVMSMDDGRVTDIIQHSLESEDQIKEVSFSPNGRYILTRAYRTPDQDDDNAEWKTLRDDILWDMAANRKVYHLQNNRFVVFSKNSQLCLMTACHKYSQFDWTENVYNLVLLQPDSGSSASLDFPKNTEFVSDPKILTTDMTNYFMCVVQTCMKKESPESFMESVRWHEIRLLVRDLSNDGNECIFLRVQNALPDANETSQFLDAFPVENDNVFLIYGNNVESYTFDATLGIVRPQTIEKGALLYNVEKEVCLKHIPSFLEPTTDINHIQFSSKFSVVLDDKTNVYSGSNYMTKCRSETEFAPNTARLALDGRYVVGLSSNYREVIVTRSYDGFLKGHMFVHGRATCLTVGADDTTVVVGCEDGRILVLCLILELSDPVKDLIERFPSRQHVPDSSRSCEKHLIKEDIRRMTCKTPDLVRLSARIQSARTENRRPPSRQMISTAVRLTRQTSQARSEACVLQ